MKQAQLPVGAIARKQSVRALVLCLLMPVIFMGQGIVSNLINPEAAAGHPNYSRNFHRLTDLKLLIFFGSLALVLALFVAVCTLVIRSKKRSLVWLLMAVLGPFGFAVLEMLDDRSPGTGTDSYERFVQKLNGFVRAGYELCAFIVIWQGAYAVMVVKRMLMIAFEAATSGVSTAQIMDIQNASSGMWAFGEGNEVMYFVILLYLLRPMAFRAGAQVVATMKSPKAS